MVKYRPLKRNFYQNDTVTVAKELLGKIIVKSENRKIISGIIVETEAYTGNDDPASHSYAGITPRNRVMFEEGGKIYVYFIYGNHFCFNIVTESKGTGSAVLIRAVEPVEGAEIMRKRRPKAKNIISLTNGPGKFCRAFGIDKKFNGYDLTSGSIILTDGKIDTDVMISRRIGIKKGSNFPYRFFIKDNKFVSKHINNRNAKIFKKGSV